jgi:hypothetical protein
MMDSCVAIKKKFGLKQSFFLTAVNLSARQKPASPLRVRPTAHRVLGRQNNAAVKVRNRRQAEIGF